MVTQADNFQEIVYRSDEECPDILMVDEVLEMNDHGEDGEIEMNPCSDTRKFDKTQGELRHWIHAYEEESYDLFSIFEVGREVDDPTNVLNEGHGDVRDLSFTINQWIDMEPDDQPDDPA